MLENAHNAPEVAFPDIIGCVDGPSRGRLHGWAFDRKNPSHRLTIAVVGPTGCQVLTLADRYRADVHQSGIGDGHYGFSFPLQRLGDAASVRVVWGQSVVELRAISPGHQQGAAELQVHHLGAYTLHVDKLSERHISGWAADATRPELRRVLQIRCNGHLQGRQRATLYRAETVDSRCDGYHGFWFSLPSGPMTSLCIEDVGLDAAFLVRV